MRKQSNSYTIEYKVGKVNMSKTNLFIEDLEDMEALEYWEDRLREQQVPFIIAFRKKKGKIKYSIFTDNKKVK